VRYVRGLKINERLPFKRGELKTIFFVTTTQLANAVLRATPREASLDVEINVPESEGRFRMGCSEPTNQLVSNGFINVVDSAMLAVTAVLPNTFIAGVEVQV
jgi:hypothetical protein